MPAPQDIVERLRTTASKGVSVWGDLVFSPFAGIGSEGYVSIEMGRRFVGAELKRSYFDLACRNLLDAREHKETGLFNDAEEMAA